MYICMYVGTFGCSPCLPWEQTWSTQNNVSTRGSSTIQEPSIKQFRQGNLSKAGTAHENAGAREREIVNTVHIYVYIYICMHACMYVCMHLCVYTSITHIHDRPPYHTPITHVQRWRGSARPRSTFCGEGGVGRGVLHQAIIERRDIGCRKLSNVSIIVTWYVSSTGSRTFRIFTCPCLQRIAGYNHVLHKKGFEKGAAGKSEQVIFSSYDPVSKRARSPTPRSSRLRMYTNHPTSHMHAQRLPITPP